MNSWGGWDWWIQKQRHTYLDQILMSVFIAGKSTFTYQLCIKQFSDQNIGLCLHISICDKLKTQRTSQRHTNICHSHRVCVSMWPGPTVTSAECLLIILIFSEKSFFSTMHRAALDMGVKTCRPKRNRDNVWSWMPSGIGHWWMLTGSWMTEKSPSEIQTPASWSQLTLLDHTSGTTKVTWMI